MQEIGPSLPETSNIASIDKPSLPTYLFGFIVSFLVNKNLSPQALLNGVGVDVDKLDDEETRMSYRQGLRLIQNALTLSDNPALGLAVGASQPLSTWGLLAYLISSSKNLLTALRMGSQYQSIATHLVSASLIVDKQVVIFQAETPFNTGNLLPFIIEEVFSSNVSLGRELSYNNNNPIALNLSYDQPEHSDAYHKFFRCPVAFNQPRNQLILDRKKMEEKLPSHHPATESLALKLCEELFNQQQHYHDTAHEVRRILLRHPGNFPSMNQVAQELGSNERNLRRQLKRLNTSFQQIYNEVREKIAMEFLNVSKLPLEDIAYLVGFTEVSAFNRAFKKWTGKSPTVFRLTQPLPRSI